jgi:competence protein ComEC
MLCALHRGDCELRRSGSQRRSSLGARVNTGRLARVVSGLDSSDRGATRSVRCYGGQSWQWDGVGFDMLHPSWESYRDATRKTNDRGCVLRITSAFGAALLPADIEAQSERELLERTPEALSADVLVAPHHGSMTSSTPRFTAQVHPWAVIFAVGYRNRFGHPRPLIVERYRELGARASASALTLDSLRS